MKLMTKAAARVLPRRHELPEQLESAHVPLKLFDPCGRWTYYAVAFDPETRHLYGYCRSPLGEDCDEWGTTSLDEVERTRNRFGLGMERDVHWDPLTTMGQVMRGEVS